MNLNIKLIEYKKNHIGFSSTYTRLADIWSKPKENKNESKIFLILLEDEIIGITGYYSTNICGSFVWHGIVLDHQKRDYSQRAIELLSDEIKNNLKLKGKIYE